MAAETEDFVHGANFMMECEDLVCVVGGDGPGAFRALELIPGLTRLSDHVLLIGDTRGIPGSVRQLKYPAVRPAMTVFPSAVAGQILCLAVAEAHGLQLEKPCAGRSRAALHAGIQREWMASTDDSLAGTQDRQTG